MRQKGKENCQKIIEYVKQYNKEKRYPPTLHDISEMLWGHREGAGNLESYITELVKQGFLSRGDKWSIRTIQLVMPQPRPYFWKAGE